jgi:hypothetical protein
MAISAFYLSQNYDNVCSMWLWKWSIIYASILLPFTILLILVTGVVYVNYIDYELIVIRAYGIGYLFIGFLVIWSAIGVVEVAFERHCVSCLDLI